MNGFDRASLLFVNQFVGRWPEFDRFVVYLSWQNILKGGVLVTLLWWAWFSGRQRSRQIVLSTLLGSFVALVAARLLANYLEFRVRPLANPELRLRVPPGVKASGFAPWSSFPSDHATLFIALAAGLCFVSRRVGIFALVYTVVVILFPRIYGGIHHPTDVIFGGLLGAAFAVAACFHPLIEKLSNRLLALEKTRPGPFYAALFITSFEVAELFEGVRSSADSMLRFMARLH